MSCKNKTKHLRNRMGEHAASYRPALSSYNKPKQYDQHRRSDYYLFHKNLGIPRSVESRLPKNNKIYLDYTRHALQAAVTDRYGIIEKLPSCIDMYKAKVIEVEVEKRSKKISKIVFRIPYDGLGGEYDLVLAVSMNSLFDGRVRTVWLNKRTDDHSTLVEDRYDLPSVYVS